MGCGACGFDAQPASASASIGQTGLIVMFTPLVDCALLGWDALRRGGVGCARCGGCGAVIGDGSGEGGLLAAIELLELATLPAPVAGLAFLDEQEPGEAECDDNTGDARGAKQAQDHGWTSASASKEAPSRVAETLNLPTGPPASSPMMTAIIAAIKPPSDQPKMV